MNDAVARFGLIGCGRIGATADDRVRVWPMAHLWLPYSHAAAIRATPRARLAAVCDVSLEAAREAARRHEVGAFYSSAEEMLARERLDAVAIATRTAERPALIRAALDAGVRGIYCDKPLATTLEETDELARSVAARGAYFVYGTKRRYMPGFRWLRGRVASGDLGTPVTVVVRLGRGALFWTHPHSVDIAGYVAGDVPVESVQADLDVDPAAIVGASVDADPVVRMASIRYVDGTVANIVAAGGQDVEAYGPSGMAAIRADGAWTEERTLSGASDLGWLMTQRVTRDEAPSSGTVGGIGALTAAILEGRHPEYDVARAQANQEVLFAMVESHLAGGKRVAMPLERRGLRITGRTGSLLA
jgi:predicted dehydrogenase